MEIIPCPNRNHKLYDSYETASQLGISPYTLHEYRKQGYIKGVSIGRGFYYLDSDIADALSYMSRRQLASASRNADRQEINTTVS